jgi:hypothetical protein
MRLSKGKRPWEFCFNPDCRKNKERIDEYNKKRGENSISSTSSQNKEEEKKNSENSSNIETSEPMNKEQ